MLQSSHENLERQLSPSKEKSLIKEKSLLIEKRLMEESNLEPEKWVKKYGRKFRRIIEEPEVIELLKTDEIKTREKIEEELYKK